MQKILMLAVAMLYSAVALGEDAQPRLPTAESPAERDARMQWWREARFGLFIHWGPVSVHGTEISWSRIGHPHDGSGLETVRPEVYDHLYKQFNPVKFDADAWMRLAKAAGMKYVVFVTKHHDGFSMWPTQLRPDYSIAAGPFHRDICKEIADAAHKQGLKLGWYYSTRDWTHPDYLKDGNAKYNDFYHGQIRELLSNYGRVDMLWFDHVAGNWGDYRFPELFDIIYRLQPNILVNNRAAAFFQPTKDHPTPEIAKLVRGDFDTPEQQIGKFQTDRPWESCMTMTQCADGGGWSYRPDGRTRTFEECLRMLVSCATGDGNLLLNVGPLPSGEIAAEQQKVLRQMGDWLETNGESIYATRGGPFRNGEWGGATYRDKTIYLHIIQPAIMKIQLPPLRAKIVHATMLTGGEPQIETSASGVTMTLPDESHDAVDVVVKLELDTPAKDVFVNGQPVAVVVPAALSLVSPQEYQVFQRNTLDEGHIVVSGQVPEKCDKLEVCMKDHWHPIAFDHSQRTFRAEIPIVAGGWYSCTVRAWEKEKLLAVAKVRHVGVGEVFIVAGQSNSANYGSQRQQTTSKMVAAFDGAKWQLANDPQPGAEGSNGSFMPAFGDALYAKIGVPIGVAAVGVGGTSVREWLPKGDRMQQQPTTGAHVRAVGSHEWESTGELFDRLAQRINALGPNGYRAVLWHQGESDAGQARGGYPADRQITGKQYQTYMKQLIMASRQCAGWPIPWFVAQATYHSAKDPADAEFRAAQASLWQRLALQGPDTDALRAEYRAPDGIHFNPRGLHRHGELWAKKVGDWMILRSQRK